MAQIVEMYLNMIYPELIPSLKEFPNVTVTGALPNKCYSFARTFTMSAKPDSKACYIEGYVFVDGIIPIGHAWRRDEQGNYVDGTTVDASFMRMGIEVPARVFQKYMKDAKFALEYERYGDVFPFLRTYRRFYPDGDLVKEIASNSRNNSVSASVGKSSSSASVGKSRKSRSGKISVSKISAK